MATQCQILKKCHYISRPLLIIFQNSFYQQQFPDVWKEVVIAPCNLYRLGCVKKTVRRTFNFTALALDDRFV